MELLDLRRLNRATLARQSLLERRDAAVEQVVHDVGGLQAQLPAPTVIGLWSRIAGFDRSQLLEAISTGRLVRGTSLRGTLHLHDVATYRELRMGVQAVLDVHVRGLHKRGLTEPDAATALELGRELLGTGALTIGALKEALASRIPDVDPQVLGSVVRHGLQLLLVPDVERPDGWSAAAPFTLAERVIGDTIEPSTPPEWFVRRFLAALGPGSAKDVQTWSGVRGIAPVMRRMLDAGELIELVTWDGTELMDLPDAPRPYGDGTAPPRFLPMWDNLLLSHADRSRVVDPAWRPYLASRNGMSPPTFLIDGFVHGTWRHQRQGSNAELQLNPFLEIPVRHQAALVAEGESLLAFLDPTAEQYRVLLG